MADEQFEDSALSEAELDALINSVSGDDADDSSQAGAASAYAAVATGDDPDPLADALGGGRSGLSDASTAGAASAQTAGLRMSTFDNAPAYAAPGGMDGFDRVQDIPLELTVELGRTRLLIKDILELGSGSIVELEKVAGEPVDLLANGLLIARGEVVVIEDSFGVRITEIITSAERKAIGGSTSGGSTQQSQSYSSAQAA